MRKISAVSISLILLCVVTGCDRSESFVGAPDQPAERLSLASSDVQNLDGEDIYRAFAFARGPVVDIFPEIFGDISYEATVDTMTADDAAKYAEDFEGVNEQELSDAWENRDHASPAELNESVSSLMGKVLEQIQTDQPGYFEELEQKMKSGDHLQVQEGLASIAEVTVPAMAEVLGVSEDAITGMQLPTPKYVVGMVAVAVAVAVALAVAAESLVTKTHVVDATENSDPSLENEVIVDRIVDRLAHE